MGAMFEQPLIHPQPETLGSLLTDTGIVAGALGLGLRFSYTGTQLLKPKTIYRGDGSYSRIAPAAGIRGRGMVTLSAGLFLLYQGLSYGNFTLINRSEKVLHSQLQTSPYDL